MSSNGSWISAKSDISTLNTVVSLKSKKNQTVSSLTDGILLTEPSLLDTTRISSSFSSSIKKDKYDVIVKTFLDSAIILSEDLSTTQFLKHARKNRIQVLESTQPNSFVGDLKPHQLKACQWLLAARANNISCILADEMGLGKTATTIAYLLQLFEYALKDNPERTQSVAYDSVTEELSEKIENSETIDNFSPVSSPVSSLQILPSMSSSSEPLYISPRALPFLRGLGPTTRGSLGPHLVICPSSVMINWLNEINRFSPSMKAIVFRPSASSIEPSAEILRANIVIANTTTFERGSKSANWLFKRAWESLVIDEAHELKNSAATRFNKACKVKARHRVLLTGTPVQNNVQELVTLLRFVAADSFLITDAMNTYNASILDSATSIHESRVKDEQYNSDSDSDGSEKDEGEKDDDDEDDEDEFLGEELVQKKIVEMVCKRSSSKHLKQLINLFVLRRTKSGVSIQLPPKIRIISYTEPTLTQKKLLASSHYTVLSASRTSTLSQVIMRILKMSTYEEALDLVNESSMAVVGQLSGLVNDIPSTSIDMLTTLAEFKDEAKHMTSQDDIVIDSDTATVTDNVTDNDCLETISSSGWSGTVMSVMRKISIHPLLVRARYSIEACLEFTEIVCAADDVYKAKKRQRESENSGSSSSKLIKRTDRVLSLCDIQRSSGSSSSFSQQLQEPSKAELTAWATKLCEEKNDLSLSESQKAVQVRVLARQAEQILSLSDLAIHSWAESLPRSAGASHLLLPREAFLDSGKVKAMLTILNKHSKTDKVLIFSQFLESLDVIERVLKMNNEETFRVDGATDILKRQSILDAFSNDSSSPRVMLLTTRTGGVGLNLSRANIVIFLDPDWSAQVMLQAEDRSHRMGQVKPVTVYRLCTRGSFEEHIQQVADGKAKLSDDILQEPEKRAKASEEMVDRMLEECLR